MVIVFILISIFWFEGVGLLSFIFFSVLLWLIGSDDVYLIVFIMSIF